MITISLCMIVKNEEKTLGRCLQSVRDAVDEIVVVDTGSSDATRQTARKYTDRIYDFAWIDDFSAARNFAFDQATKDYILWLDADDILLTADRLKLKELKKHLDADVDTVMMKYNTGFDSDGNVTFSYYRERLVKRSRRFRWREPVHEYLETGGKIINSDICVTHTKQHGGPSGRNIAIYEKLLAKGEVLSPRGLYYYARELKDNGRHTDAIHFFSRFLDDGKGWMEDNIGACLELAACYEMENQPQEQLRSLTRTFVYDTPRGEACCRIGYFYKARGDYERAVFWFRLALSLRKPRGSWGFIQDDCWGYIPAIELAVCYDHLGSCEMAETFNELAGKFKPGNPSVAYNRRYFREKRAKKRKAEENPK